MNHVDVILRCCTGMTPQWQYYSLGVSVLGGANSLAEAKSDALETLEFELDGEEVSAHFHTEMIGAEATANRPAVWVRALQDEDAERRIERQNMQVWLTQQMRSNAGRTDRTFDGLAAATGDIVAVVGLPDDLVQSVTRQTSSVGSVWVGVAENGGVTWLGLDAHPLPDGATQSASLADIGVTPASTLHELVRATNDAEMIDSSARRVIAV